MVSAYRCHFDILLLSVLYGIDAELVFRALCQFKAEPDGTGRDLISSGSFRCNQSFTVRIACHIVHDLAVQIIIHIIASLEIDKESLVTMRRDFSQRSRFMNSRRFRRVHDGVDRKSGSVKGQRHAFFFALCFRDLHVADDVRYLRIVREVYDLGLRRSTLLSGLVRQHDLHADRCLDRDLLTLPVDDPDIEQPDMGGASFLKSQDTLRPGDIVVINRV